MLRRFLTLDYGVASSDTFERVFALLDPKSFECAFRSWVAMVIPALGHEQVIAIDGKSSRRTTSKAAAAPLHLVSAFAAAVGVVLGQVATGEKSNEITAIPELLGVLDIKDCIVTIDAMGTQTAIARTIRERGAHYVLCVKDNLQRCSIRSCRPTPAWPGRSKRPVPARHARADMGARKYVCARPSRPTRGSTRPSSGPDLRSFATVKRTRIVAGKKSVEWRHYISSLPPDADKIAHAVRSHWEVENRLHWCLDVQFSDDCARARSGHVAHNLALVRHIALNLIRLNT